MPLYHENQVVNPGADKTQKIYSTDRYFAQFLFESASRECANVELPWMVRDDWLLTWRRRSTRLKGKERLTIQVDLLHSLTTAIGQFGPTF